MPSLPFLSSAIAVVTFAFSAGATTTHAAEAFFSEDGSTVTTIVNLHSALTGIVQIDIATGKATQLKLTGPAAEADVECVAQGAEGELLFLSGETIWLYQEDAAPKKVTSTLPVKECTDLFVDTREGSPTEGWMFISGILEENGNVSPTIHARKPGGKKFVPIFCRRVDDARAGVFSEDGRLYFTSSGDLWEGAITPESDVEERLGVLLGARVAPLAFLNTDDANGGGMWVGGVAPVGEWVYAHLRGHHMGSIVRTPILEKPLFTEEQPGFPSLKDSFDTNAKALADTEIIADNFEDIHGFCVTEQDDGTALVFFYSFPDEENKGPALYLWKGEGEPEVIGHLPVPKE